MKHILWMAVTLNKYNQHIYRYVCQQVLNDTKLVKLFIHSHLFLRPAVEFDIFEFSILNKNILEGVVSFVLNACSLSPLNTYYRHFKFLLNFRRFLLWLCQLTFSENSKVKMKLNFLSDLNYYLISKYVITSFSLK